jgi:cytochrome c peroxidase
MGEAVDLEVYSREARDGRPLILTPVQRADLVAFLQSLTSDDLATDRRRAGL